MPLRRARGWVLRLARRRRLATLVGLLLVVPAAWLELSGGTGIWWIDGLTLLAGSTGVALIWSGFTRGKV
jgi:hypothetical protein